MKPVANAGMLIRKPAPEVFEAFVNPAITTKFWFTKGSGRLEAGKSVRWEWEMYNVSTQVNVKAIEQNARILMDWGDPGDFTEVEWIFKTLPDGTFVDVTNRGFTGSKAEVVAKALDSTGGFTLVLAGAKAYLEHKLELNLVRDRFPEGK